LITNIKKILEGSIKRVGAGTLGGNSPLTLINNDTGELDPGKVYLIIITSSLPIYGIFIFNTTTSQINKLLSSPTLSMAFNSTSKQLNISNTPSASIPTQFSVEYNIITLN
jgi:hypothetical protein